MAALPPNEHGWKAVIPETIPSLRFLVYVSLLVLCRACYKYIEQDYKSFLALGPGGTPCSFRGYTQVSFISLFRLRNPYCAPDISPRLQLKHGLLKDLIPRCGTRPRLVGIAPQRQVTQTCSTSMVQVLQAAIREFADACPSHLLVDISAFEKHSEALFSRYLTFNEPNYYGEIVHSHASDGSMHLVLHPDDVKTVLQTGWGERHPLSRGITWWWRAPVPRGFMIIYGPRDISELQQVKKIIRAATWWVSGVDPVSQQTQSSDNTTSNVREKTNSSYKSSDSLLEYSSCLGAVVPSSCAEEIPIVASSQL